MESLFFSKSLNRSPISVSLHRNIKAKKVERLMTGKVFYKVSHCTVTKLSSHKCSNEYFCLFSSSLILSFFFWREISRLLKNTD